MRDNTEQLIELASYLSDGIITINDYGHVISVNDSACNLTGYSKGELIGQSFANLFPAQTEPTIPVIPSPYYHPLERSLVAREKATFKSKPRGRELLLNIVPSNGQNSLPAIRVKAIAILQNNNQLSADDDPRAARIQMLGLFATGVAHDINNDLTAIKCSTQFAHLLITQVCSNLKEGDTNYLELESALEHLESTETITNRTATLTKQLLAYARQKQTEKEPVNLNEAIRETLGLVKKIIGEKIEIKTNLGELLPAVLAERSQIDRILTNVILNARDAMPRGGTLTINTTECYLDEAFAEERRPWAKPGRYIHLRISDTGKGMDTQTLRRIYEEFFTTKAKGTGLGLRTVYQIVKDNDGMIDANSELGKGTSFDIYLPPTEKRGSRREEEGARVGSQRVAPQDRKNFFVLIAEDKRPVRDLMEQVLIQSGYRVETVANGRQAVERFSTLQATGEAVALTILDIGMPVLDGRSAKDEIRRLNPEAAIILTSSYDDEEKDEAENGTKDYLFLSKPFNGYKLLEMIETSLEQKENAGDLTGSRKA